MTDSPWARFGLGLTLIDALDTLWLMGLGAEFDEAEQWVTAHFHPVMTAKDVNTFETTIRVLGGLLATHALSQKQVFLDRAVEMADHLLPAFGTKVRKTPIGPRCWANFSPLDL